MYYRKNKIINWLNRISEDISMTYDIFAHGLISADDIGEDEMFNLMDYLREALVILDDILFKLEGER